MGNLPHYLSVGSYIKHYFNIITLTFLSILSKRNTESKTHCMLLSQGRRLKFVLAT